MKSNVKLMYLNVHIISMSLVLNLVSNGVLEGPATQGGHAGHLSFQETNLYWSKEKYNKRKARGITTRSNEQPK